MAFALLGVIFILHVYGSKAISNGSSVYGDFISCVAPTSHTDDDPSIHDIIFSRTNASYTSILRSYIRNSRYETPCTPKPAIIVTPLHASHVQAAVICARKLGLELRIRSGGHDYEGASYVSPDPFVMLDMSLMRDVEVDAESETAVIQVGATLGEVYYGIWQKTKVHGFPGGVISTVGVGGHVSGGGYGYLMRRYGLTVDQVIDAKIVDANGRILNRRSMGEDLFWAIRGGGGASFGVILSFKVRLVRVPETVTIFQVKKTLEEDGTDMAYSWQKIASTIDDRLFMRMHARPKSFSKGKNTIEIQIVSLFLGGAEELVTLLHKEFPLLGLKVENCTKANWIQNVLWWSTYEQGASPESALSMNPQTLLDRKPGSSHFLKRKSDYVVTPISKSGFEYIWNKSIELGKVNLAFDPYGGRMEKIGTSDTPFAHRAGHLYYIQYTVDWNEAGMEADEKNVELIRSLYKHLTPLVSKNPRTAFFNDRDYDLGINNHGNNSYQEGKVYGVKYFVKNFHRLVKVKTAVDPHNFFKYEQSIPTLKLQSIPTIKLQSMTS